MIGIDSNVLVRLLTGDDPDQVARAEALLLKYPEPDSILINIVVLLETLWLLRSRFKFANNQLHAVTRDLLSASEFQIERREVVLDALEVSRIGGGQIADCIIASLNRANGCSTTLTFDANAARDIPAMELLA